MSPPPDRAALGALVGRASITSIYCSCYGCKAIAPLVPAAQAALERVEEIVLKDRGKTNEITILTKENREQAARLARLEGALRRVRAIVSPAIVGQHECDDIDAALGSQPHDADTVKWHRAHGPVIQGDAAVTSEASAQAARDVAYWRRRAEDAEARAVREGRDE